jgi:hypothetical protein
MSDYQRLKYDYAPWSYIIERHENRTNKWQITIKELDMRKDRLDEMRARFE